MTRTLDVWLGDAKVGCLGQDETGALTFAYDAAYPKRGDARAISLSMPLRDDPYPDRVVRPFFSGLLPDDAARQCLAARLNLPAPRVEMRRIGETSYLLIERYDRALQSNGNTFRLHQKDFCQALSVPPELRYEEEGGPGIQRSLDLIHRASCRPAADRLLFLRMIIFQYLVGNADAHGKNYALLYRSKTPELAPLYDVLCTAVYPRLSKKLAMAIGGRRIPDTIHWEQWQSLVPPTKAAQRLLLTIIGELTVRMGGEADRLILELKDQAIDHHILRAIRGVIGARVELLEQSIQNQ